MLFTGCAPIKEFHNPPTMFAAGGYTNAVAVTGGKTVYIAGQVAFDTKGTIVGKGDLRAQFRQVYENVRLALAAAGATPDAGTDDRGAAGRNRSHCSDQTLKIRRTMGSKCSSGRLSYSGFMAAWS